MVDPFLRWAGGKRWLAARLHTKLAPAMGNGRTYYEPFLGSGSMFFRMAPSRAFLSDLNAELIHTFQMVAQAPTEIKERLQKLPASRRRYEELRSSKPTDPVERAVRFIYLNRNCWGGLYRENQFGDFNTPWGGGERTHLSIAKTDGLSRAGALLGQPGVRMVTIDFEDSVDRAVEGDVVYCDPTYRQTTRRQFDRYGKTIFAWQDQQRLAAAAWRAFHRGVLIIVSNASCLSIRELYSGAGLIRVHRPKGLAPANNDIQQAEYLFVLDPAGTWTDWSRIGTVIRRQDKRVGRSSLLVARASS